MLRRLLRDDNIIRMAHIVANARWEKARLELAELVMGVEEGMRKDQRMEGLL